MQPLITYMQQLDSGDVLAWAGMLSLIGFGLWAAAQIIISGVLLYADLAWQRAKEREDLHKKTTVHVAKPVQYSKMLKERDNG